MPEILGWNDRLAWSGETPLDYPGLNPVAAMRFDTPGPAAGTWRDAVDPARVWKVDPWLGTEHRTVPGPRGVDLELNRLDPENEQGALVLDHFEGLWPSSGKLLIGLWVSQNYTMAHNPLMSTRSGPGYPLAYLATTQAAAFRHQVYDFEGDVCVDSFEAHGWGHPTGWVWIGQLIDFDANTSQLVAVDQAGRRSYLSPARSLTYPPNPSCEADLLVFALPHAEMYTGGMLDEVFVAHPTAEFDLAEYAERLRLGTWARGQYPTEASALTVTDVAVSATSAITLETGAQAVSWSQRPEPTNPAAIPHWSTDNGATWNTGTLPASLTGLLRWEIPLNPGALFTGLTLLPPAPTLAAIADTEVEQRDEVNIPLTVTADGPVTWSVAAPGLTASITGTTLKIEAGWASGAIPVTVTATDQWNRSAVRTFTLTVTPAEWEPPETPQYPHAPIIIDGETPEGDVAIIDPLESKTVSEINGEQSFTFAIPIAHQHAEAVRPEAGVELASELYRIRRITTDRKRGTPVLSVYCEALFYDLAYAGQLPEREFLQTPAGAALEWALEGTGWSIAAVTVTTRRTYTVEADSNPLAVLRLVAQQHGGDLLFDNTAKTVSLVTQSGQDRGVSFFYGLDLTDSKRVVDTTSLVTRIHGVNADGVTIAAVNDGKSYVENFDYTTEVRSATYDFAAGTSPWTMLEMCKATLANRAKPSYSYEFTVADLSAKSGQEIDRFDVGDRVTVVDEPLGITESQRIIRVEHDVVRPWRSKITLSGKLRSAGNSAADTAGLTMGTNFAAFDLVPYNLLKNGRFDNGLAHWAASGVSIVAGRGTGDHAIRFAGPGVRWVEQTVSPDNRDVYALSLDVAAVGGGSVPPLKAFATVEYEDGTTETIPVELA